MSISRYCTVGAVVPDVRAFKGLGDRLEELNLSPGSVVVLARRRDVRLARNILPEARVESAQSGLSRRQWLEFASTFFSASTVSFLMAAVHLWTGLIVQAVLTLASIVGLVLYHRRPHVQRRLLRLGMPERLAGEWESSFKDGFALLLATVPEDLFDETQGAFLEDDVPLSPLAVDRRPVL
jgi:hypothetical protein